jgi:hypothetical protein
MPHRLQAAHSRLLDWPFWLWAAVGLGFGFGISVVGIVTVPAATLVTVFLLTRKRLRQGAYGLLVGIGMPLLLIAYLNREGPGTVCHTVDGGRGTQCDDLYDPRKWAAAGLAFIAVGMIAHVLSGGNGSQLRSRS